MKNIITDIINRLFAALFITSLIAMFVGGLYLGNYNSGWWFLMSVFAAAFTAGLCV
jgi:hypothetical protein